MISVVACLVGGILFILSGIHLYWVFGGQKGVLVAIPSEGSKLKFQPTKIATGIVTGLLGFAGWFVLELGEVIERRYSLIGYFFMGVGSYQVYLFYEALGIFVGLDFLRNKKEPYLLNGMQCCFPRYVFSLG